MMLKSRSTLAVFGAALAAIVTVVPAPAFAQTASSGAASYAAGVDLGRTLHDPRECTGSGDYRQGCVDGVTESQFDQQADQAMDSVVSEPKPAQPTPRSSPPLDVQKPSSNPGGSAPPN